VLNAKAVPMGGMMNQDVDEIAKCPLPCTSTAILR
jgi:hypothetical protein